MLNVAQLQAVEHLQGQCLVLAGAGSGKTRVITQKIGRLLHSGMPARNIAAITFTNKAASEMKERVQQLMGRRGKDVLICTFHALGVRILRQDGHHLGLTTQFSIMDSSDVLGLLKDVGTTDAATARQWQWVISGWKGQGWDASIALQNAQNDEERHIAHAMHAYQDRLNAFQAVDFDDLIQLPLQLLRTNEQVRERWQKQLQHTLVDEYQDTNATQYEVLKLLTGENGHFTAVGDDDQSIYGWRGATLDNLKRLPQDFPNLRIITLEQNYRSTSAILQAANNVIELNPKLYPKKLWSDLGKGDPVRVVDADSEEHEAERTVAHITSLRLNRSHQHQSHIDYKHFAILYRANHQAKPFEKALRKANLPYKVSGGQGFFDRAEIKDLCAWFRLWMNKNDDPAFIRAITSPKRGVGHQSLEHLGKVARNYKVSLFDALFLSALNDTRIVTPSALDSLHEFGREILELETNAQSTFGTKDCAAFLTKWLDGIRYEQHLVDTEDNEKVAKNRWENVVDFCEWMSKRCGDAGAKDERHQTVKSLFEVAQTVSLLSTLGEREKDQNAITLSTLHAAKGLEWPHVVLVGVNEGTLPFERESSTGTPEVNGDAQFNPIEENMDTDTDIDANNPVKIRIEEERRLMYVGITRAQRTLLVSWTKKRKKGRTQILATPSRFIAEMKLNVATSREDPREKLKALRAEFAKKAGLL